MVSLQQLVLFILELRFALSDSSRRGIFAYSTQVSTAHYQHRLYRMVTCFRGGTVSLIYNRTLQLKADKYDELAALTLVSTDLDRLTIRLQSLNEMWARTIEIAIGIWLLERQLGWVCMAPVLIVVCGCPFLWPSICKALMISNSPCHGVCKGKHAHWTKTKALGSSHSTQDWPDVFDAIWNEKRQDDGSCHDFIWHVTNPEGQGAGTVQEFQDHGFVEDVALGAFRSHTLISTN
jgi:hypothetical protein